MGNVTVCKCGSDLFIESRGVSGQWKALITGTGEIDDTDLSGLSYRLIPKTVTCAECGKRNPNPRYGTGTSELRDT